MNLNALWRANAAIGLYLWLPSANLDAYESLDVGCRPILAECLRTWQKFVGRVKGSSSLLGRRPCENRAAFWGNLMLLRFLLGLSTFFRLLIHRHCSLQQLRSNQWHHWTLGSGMGCNGALTMLFLHLYEKERSFPRQIISWKYSSVMPYTGEHT